MKKLFLASILVLFSFNTLFAHDGFGDPDEDLVRLLDILQITATKNGRIFSEVEWEIWRQHFNSVLEDGPNPNLRSSQTGSTALHWAAQQGDAKFVKYLLGMEAKIDQLNDAGFSALHYARLYNREDVINLLILNGASLSSSFFNSASSIRMSRHFVGFEERRVPKCLHFWTCI